MSNVKGYETLKEQFMKMNDNALTIPNILSLFRIIVIPFFVFFFLSGNYVVAVSIIFISGLTDLFDGKIARHFNQISELGKLLDPAADKLTQVTVSFTFFMHYAGLEDKKMRMFSYIFLLFIIKDILMIVGSFVLLSLDIVPRSAIIFGKIATMLFYLVMGTLMLFSPTFGVFSRYFRYSSNTIIVLVSISAFSALLAFCSYMPHTIKNLKARKGKG